MSQDWLLQGSTDPHEVAERYDAWAESYDGDLDAWSYAVPQAVAEMVRAARPAAGSVLDAGCGTGLVGRALRASGFGGELVGLDVSEESLRVAERAGGYDRLRPTDLQQRLDLPDDSADVLVCAGVMTYLPEVEAVWREFARVVRSSGLVVVTQREDVWDERSCQAVADRLTEEGVWRDVTVSEPSVYMPQTEGALADVGVRYLSATVD